MTDGVESVNNISSSQLRKESDDFIKNYKGVAISILESNRHKDVYD